MRQLVRPPPELVKEASVAAHHQADSPHPRATQRDAQPRQSLSRLAVSATVHCLTGCAIGEILGMILATWWGWGNFASIVLSIVLAFFFGYGLTSTPLLRAGV